MEVSVDGPHLFLTFDYLYNTVLTFLDGLSDRWKYFTDIVTYELVWFINADELLVATPDN